MRIRLAALALAAFALLPATAQAATNRYAEVGGGNTEPCAFSDPCDIVTAINSAGAGDDVTLLGGVPPAAPYTATTGLNIPLGVTVHGAPGARPRVVSSVAGDSSISVNPSAVLRDVSIEHTDGNGPAVFSDGGTVERVHAKSAGHWGCATANGSVIRDSVCWTTTLLGGNAAGLTAQTGSFGVAATVTLRNVTAVASDGAASGVNATVFGTNATLNVNATNVIAQSAGGSDVTGEGHACCTGEVLNITLDHSNYDSEFEDDSSGTVTITAHGTGTASDNETAPPDFVDAASGDFRQTSASTGTISQGVGGLVNGFGLGALDLDGQIRSQGSAPDIGADEFPAPSTGTPTPPAGVPASTGNPPTGERAAALKKCAKVKKNKKKKKKCKKRARTLPV